MNPAMTKMERDQGAGRGTLIRWREPKVGRSFQMWSFEAHGASATKVLRRNKSEDRLVALLNWADARPKSWPDCPVDRFKHQREREGAHGQDADKDNSEL